MFIGFHPEKMKGWNARYPGYSNVVILSPFPKSYLKIGKINVVEREI